LVNPDWNDSTEGEVPGSGKTYRIPSNVKAELHGVKTKYNDLEIFPGTSLAISLSTPIDTDNGRQNIDYRLS
jgi:hypothetical protein